MLRVANIPSRCFLRNISRPSLTKNCFTFQPYSSKFSAHQHITPRFVSTKSDLTHQDEDATTSPPTSAIDYTKPIDLPEKLATQEKQVQTKKSRSILARNLRLYRDLGKANLSLLVAISSLAVWFAAGPPFTFLTPTCLFGGTFLLSASAASLNHIIERDYDKLMKRTRMRPLPSGRMTVTHAKAFALGSALIGSSVLYVGTNALTVSIGLGTLVTYAFVYTPLKRVHWLNTEVGAIVGALPPLMGWSASTGHILCREAFLLFLAQMFWQLPHFMSIAWRNKDDYLRGGFKMLSGEDPTGKRTAGKAVVYAALLSALPIVSSLTGATSWMFAVDGSVICLYQLYIAVLFYRNPSRSTATALLFPTSVVTLTLFLILFVLHSTKWRENKDGDFFAANFDVLRHVGARHCPSIFHQIETDEISNNETRGWCPVPHSHKSTKADNV